MQEMIISKEAAGTQTFETAITKLSIEMFVELRILSKRGHTMKLKSKLREYIGELEDLYGQIKN